MTGFDPILRRQFILQVFGVGQRWPGGWDVRNRPLVVALIAVIVVLAGAVGFLLINQSKDGAAPAVTTEDIGDPTGSIGGIGGTGGVTTDVVAVTVSEGSVGRGVRLTGNVKPIRDVTLVSKVPGTVLWTAGAMGTRVQSGEPVLRLDDTELQLQLAQATAGHAAAKANLARLESGAAQEEVAQVE